MKQFVTIFLFRKKKYLRKYLWFVWRKKRKEISFNSYRLDWLSIALVSSKLRKYSKRRWPEVSSLFFFSNIHRLKCRSDTTKLSFGLFNPILCFFENTRIIFFSFKINYYYNIIIILNLFKIDRTLRVWFNEYYTTLLKKRELKIFNLI